MRRIFPYGLLCLLALFGCAGTRYTEQVTAVPLSQDRQSADSRVLAKAEEWMNSGVVVEKENTYVIQAKGRWVAGPT